MTESGDRMRKLRRIGIGIKITSGYFILIICLAISVIILNSQITNLQQERNRIIQYDSSMRTLSNELERKIVTMESSLHRYLMTRDETYLKKYDEELATWEAKYDELEKLVQDFSSDEEQLLPIYAEIVNWINTFGKPLNEAISTQNTDEIRAAYAGDYSSIALKSLQERFSDFHDIQTVAIQEEINNLNNRNTVLTFGLFFSLVLLSVITIILVTIISRRIVGSITEVTEAIQHIDSKDGHVKKLLQAKTDDEVRDLVEATNALLSKIKQRQWFQTNLAQIVTTYQGVDTLHELGNVLLDALTTRTNSVYGAFYVQDVKNPVTYKKIASFAEASDEIGRMEIEAGKGFIGQSIQTKRTLTYSNDGDALHYLETALGNMPISHGVIIPILFGKEVVAVLELASLHHYSEQHLKLLEEVVVHLGVTINSIQGRMEIVRLLNESQTMTEELQVQSEELQTQSEELKLRTEELTTINERLEERTKEAEQKSLALEQAQLELQQTAHQLRESSNYKSEFLANMSHELRTPLNSILILSEMLSENPSKNLSEDELEYAKVIHNSGQDLLNLINDILDLSKVEAGKMDLWFSETDLATIPQHITNLFAPVAKKKNIELTVDLVDDHADIFYTDVKRFYQIINNLLSNALKFTEEGSVHVSISKPTLTSTMAKLSDTWVKVSVTDTGIGISEDKQTIIFESFQQADGATIRKYGGTGLGLSICREMSKLLGGWIELESIEGEGSTFTVYLPSLPDGALTNESTVADDSLEVAADIETLGNCVFNNKRILLVDDDPRNIYALRHALEQKGVHIIEAANGAECLQLLESGIHVDAVLMDIMMPEMDGYETMEHIRHTLQMTDLPIIALTAKAMKQDRERAFEVGASDYISKPIDLEQLFSLLTVWLTSKDNVNNG